MSLFSRFIGAKYSQPKEPVVTSTRALFQNSGDSRCHTPKMSHYATTCDVIGHDVMVKPVIPNERPGAELYGSEVSWSK